MVYLLMQCLTFEKSENFFEKYFHNDFEKCLIEHPVEVISNLDLPLQIGSIHLVNSLCGPPDAGLFSINKSKKVAKI